MKEKSLMVKEFKRYRFYRFMV